MAGKASVENGKLGGRPPGRLNNKTIELKEARETARQAILERLMPLIEAQYTVARGASYMFYIEEKKNGAREHVLVTDPDEIGDILAQMDGMESGVFNDQYYYITTKSPDNRAIDSMLDRALGKAQQSVDLTTKGKTINSLKELSDEQLAAIAAGSKAGTGTA